MNSMQIILWKLFDFKIVELRGENVFESTEMTI